MGGLMNDLMNDLMGKLMGKLTGQRPLSSSSPSSDAGQRRLGDRMN
jgi:hypothetical protein